jgi:hypothetical protein
VNSDTDDLTDPVAIDITSRMGVIGDDACIELIQSSPVGRVGFVADDGLLVLPVNHAWHDGGVVFRSLEGQKLSAAAENQEVCFEVDHWDSHERSGWSVVVQGTAREITDWAEKEQLENIGLVPWARDQWRQLWIRIEPTAISGRSLVEPEG